MRVARAVRWKLLLLIFPLLLIFFITITKKNFPERQAGRAFANANTTIAYVSLRDTLPASCVQAMGAVEKNGVVIRYADGSSTAYYEYEAEQDRVLEAIGKLPFVKSNAVSDFACNAMPGVAPFVSRTAVWSDSKIALQFLSSINTNQFVAFECRKYPAKHTLLLDTRSKRILHKVEMM